MKLTSMQFDGGGDTAPATPAKPLAPTPLAAQEGGAIGAASMASQYKEPGKGAGMKMGSAKKAKTPVDKSGYDRSIKVSQSTVDAVKRAGAYGSQKNAKEGMPGYYGSSLNPKAPASAEYKEAVKRVYPNPAKEPKAPMPKAVPPSRTSPKNAEKKAGPTTSPFPPILPGAQNMPYKPSDAKPKIENMPYKPSDAKPKIEKMPFKPSIPPSRTSPKNAENKAKAPIKVSQATVDSVKKDGKAKAIANAKTNVTNAEYKEAVRRVYQSPAKAKPKAKSGGGGGGRPSRAVK